MKINPIPNKNAIGERWTEWEKQPNGSSWRYRTNDDGIVIEKVGHYCPYIPLGLLDKQI